MSATEQETYISCQWSDVKWSIHLITGASHNDAVITTSHIH